MISYASLDLVLQWLGTLFSYTGKELLHYDLQVVVPRVKVGNELLEMCEKEKQSHLVDRSRKNFCFKKAQNEKIL